MKKLLVLSLTSLLFLAMATVRIRNRERITGYRIAALERERVRLADEVMALKVKEAEMSSLPRLLKRAFALGIDAPLPGGAGLFPEFDPLRQGGKGKEAFLRKDRRAVE